MGAGELPERRTCGSVLWFADYKATLGYLSSQPKRSTVRARFQPWYENGCGLPMLLLKGLTCIQGQTLDTSSSSCGSTFLPFCVHLSLRRYFLPAPSSPDRPRTARPTRWDWIGGDALCVNTSPELLNGHCRVLALTFFFFVDF